MLDEHNRPLVLGWREWVRLPELHVKRVKAKLDTGARTSTLHAFFVESYRHRGAAWVRFGIHPLQRRKDILRFCEAPVLEKRRVKDSGGHIEKRYVIRTTAVMGALSWPIDITLTNRDLMLFRMLLGRKAVENRFLLNPGRSYLTGRSLTKAYKTKIKKKAPE